MIDLILWGPDKDALRSFATSNQLMTTDEEGNDKFSSGLQYHWWAGTGHLCLDDLNPENIEPGLFVLIRFSGEFLKSDLILIPENTEQEYKIWDRSKIANYFKTQGTSGELSGIPYYELGGIRVFTYFDLNTFLKNKNMPSHRLL